VLPCLLHFNAVTGGDEGCAKDSTLRFLSILQTVSSSVYDEHSFLILIFQTSLYPYSIKLKTSMNEYS